MAADVSTVMDQVGTALATVTGLRVFDFPPKSAQPPFAFVDMPDKIEFDCTFQRGCDRATFTVVVGVADVVDREARDQVTAFVDDVKAALDKSAGQACRVVSCEFRPVALSGGQYSGAIFTLDIVY